MPESGSNKQVTVMAEERAHPAIVKLARACIALAREQLHPASAGPVTDSSPQPAPQGHSQAGSR
jgi:hypothetical protein